MNLYPSALIARKLSCPKKFLVTHIPGYRSALIFRNLPCPEKLLVICPKKLLVYVQHKPEQQLNNKSNSCFLDYADYYCSYFNRIKGRIHCEIFLSKYLMKY